MLRSIRVLLSGRFPLMDLGTPPLEPKNLTESKPWNSILFSRIGRRWFKNSHLLDFLGVCRSRSRLRLRCCEGRARVLASAALSSLQNRKSAHDLPHPVQMDNNNNKNNSNNNDGNNTNTHTNEYQVLAIAPTLPIRAAINVPLS